VPPGLRVAPRCRLTDTVSANIDAFVGMLCGACYNSPCKFSGYRQHNHRRSGGSWRVAMGSLSAASVPGGRRVVLAG
jgi:hypothetical protein